MARTRLAHIAMANQGLAQTNMVDTIIQLTVHIEKYKAFDQGNTDNRAKSHDDIHWEKSILCYIDFTIHKYFHELITHYITEPITAIHGE